MSAGPLSPSLLLRLMEASLGSPLEAQSAPDSASTEPHTLRNAYDAIALLVHACMLTVGFRLIGLEEDHKLESPIDEQNIRPLPPGWNLSSAYSFRYAHYQSSLEFCIKINRLGNKAVIFGIGIGDDKTTSFDIVAKDYLSESFFPCKPGDMTEDQTPKQLRDAFISESRLRDFASLIKINIIQKLIPGLNKPGYQEEAAEVRAMPGSSSARPPVRPDYEDPLRIGPRYPMPYGPGPVPNAPPIPAGGERIPGFDDEYEILGPARGDGGGLRQPGRNPLSYGDEDLNPPGLGPNPPLRGPFFGEGGLPRPGLGGTPIGGMHPTPDHPMFGGRGGIRGGPDPRFPPGARYDPVGPEPDDLEFPTRDTGGPRFGPGGRGGGGMFGHGGGAFGGRRGGGGFGGFGGFGTGDFI